MSDPTQTPTTVSNIGVAMFTVADQDAALAFYTEKLGYEVRGDIRFGETPTTAGSRSRLPGSRTRLALNPPMGGQPGGGSIGVETPGRPRPSTRGSRPSAASTSIRSLMHRPAPRLLFILRDPDGNYVWVVETPAA